VKDRVQVILPVEQGRNYLPREKIGALPLWSRRFVCPVDKRPTKVGKMPGEYNCTRCDKNGGVGCYYGQPTERLLKAMTEPARSVEEKVIEDLKNAATRRLHGEQLAGFLATLDGLISAVRAGVDVTTAGTAREGDAGQVGADALPITFYPRGSRSGNEGDEESGASEPKDEYTADLFGKPLDAVLPAGQRAARVQRRVRAAAALDVQPTREIPGATFATVVEPVKRGELQTG